MILLCGIPTEPPLAMVSARLERAGVPFVVFNQRRFAAAAIEWDIAGDMVTGRLTLDGRRYRLEDFRGVYSRLMNDMYLPELRDEPPDSERRRHSGRLHDALIRWCEIAPMRMVNRIRACGSNTSKTFQGQLIRDFGFHVPETLLTNDPERARAFLAEKGAVVAKSASGARSIVTRLTDRHDPSFERVAHCPTLFQEFIPGTNVRVHVVAETVFPTAVATGAVDYRYSSEQTGERATLQAATLPDDVADRCIRLTAHLGLAFSGIDLLIEPDGTTYCLEANPCPGFSYFEANTGQPISLALAEYLAGSLDH